MTRKDADWLEEEQSAEAIPFEFPDDGGLLARIRDYFLTKYSGDISATDAAFLAQIFADVRPEDLVTRNERRVASLRMVEILVAMDQAMLESKDPVRTWRTIGLALGLPSATEITCASLGRQSADTRCTKHPRSGISKMAISKSVKALRESFDVAPAFTNHGSLNFRFL